MSPQHRARQGGEPALTWTKLSDDFADDCWDLSSDAFRTHVEGLTWSNRKLLDLRIPKVDFRRFAKRPDAVTELLDAGWWADDGDAYIIRHHAVYQRTRDAVLRQQAARQANGRKGGRPPKTPREQAANISSKTEQLSYPVSEQLSSSVSYPVTSSGRVSPGDVQKTAAQGSPETEQLSYQLTEQLTERDRPGQDWTWSVQKGDPKTNGHRTATPDVGKPCDRCGSTGSTRVNGFGHRLCTTTVCDGKG